MVKIDFGNTVIAHYNINNIIYIIVSNNRVPEIDFDHFDLDHNDHEYFYKHFVNREENVVSLYHELQEEKQLAN
jgi:hypothetical protein